MKMLQSFCSDALVAQCVASSKSMSSSGECPVCRCSAQTLGLKTKYCDTDFRNYQRILHEAKKMEKKDWDKATLREKNEWAEAIKLYKKEMEKKK